MSTKVEEDNEEYKQQSDFLKEEGNRAFQEGKLDLAVQFFTQAITIDPDNHLLYSNRSAAYMKLDFISKALHDAEKCVELAPQWSKGYNRLGIAQQGLKRFDAAIQTFKKGIEIDPNNSTLWSSLKLCEKAYEIDKEQKFRKAALERELEEERIQRRESLKKEILAEKKKEEEEHLFEDFMTDLNRVEEEQQPPPPVITTTEEPEEDNLLASFFSEVTNNDNSKAKNNPGISEEAEEEAAPSLLTEKYVKQSLGTGKEIVERLTGKFYEWKNLNPYLVFDLDIDATEEDIKYRYKKLSLKVHPDRLRDVENAREAFEEVKKAYEKLMDEDQRKTIMAHIENVTEEVKRDRRKVMNITKLKEEELPSFQEERKKRILKHFADMEQMRRLSEKNQRIYNAREKQQEAEEEEKAKRFQEFDKEWSEENRREDRVGNWRDFQQHGDPPTKKLKVAHFKEENRKDPKFGKVQLEEWKKSWK